MSAYSALLGLCALVWLPIEPAAYSPDADEALELLRDRVASGLAGQETYDTFLAFLAERPDDGCEAWAEAAEARDADLRWREIREAMAEACPDPAEAGGDPALGNMEDTLASPRGRGLTAQASISQTVRPRQDADAAAAGSPLLRAQAALPGLSGRASLLGYRLENRFLHIGGSRLALLAGHLQPAQTETRLGFVAGGRFYAGWSGSSGIAGPLASEETALDGLGLHARAGKWILEAAGTWNRLRHGAAASALAQPRNDAGLFSVGMAHRFGPLEWGWDFQAQAATQRFASAATDGSAAAFSVAGASLASRAQDRVHGSLGWAVSYADAPSAAIVATDPGGTGASHPDPRLRPWGGYLEAALASPAADSAEWRLQLRQADAAWANPLQSPRGYLRDTLGGQWILPGRGEGGLSARTRFPLAVFRAYRAGIGGGGMADWGQQGLLAGEGNLSVTQSLGAWTHQAGATAGFLRAAGRGWGDANGSGRGGWGQSLAWRQGESSARAAFAWKAGGYSGSLPAPLSLECKRSVPMAWSLTLLTGDIRDPGSYLRCEVKQGWTMEKRIQVEQTLRLPWTRGGLAGDLGYRLRLTAVL